ncbi:MAG TPA: hypothetical protein VND70_09915 [Acidimicrobiales bacterium]|nr:hypothetical protein [Acidimicrobiales bacterium]
MSSRLRRSAFALLAAVTVLALSSSAGAASQSSYGLTANGGFISLSLLNTAQVTGAGSAADSTKAGPVDASGTGVCVTLASTTSPCPSSATSPLSSGDLVDTTQRASAATAGSTGTPTPATACLTNLALGVLNLALACGHATASQDSSGNPTASGEGDLGTSSVTLALDSIPGLSGVLGSGALCPSSSGSSAASAAVPTAVVTGLLTTVNQLLGAVDPSAPPIPAPSSSSPLSPLCQVLAGVTAALPALGGALSSLTGSTPLLTVALGHSTSTIATSISGSSGSSGDTIQTSTATTQGVHINLLGAVDLSLGPNTASIQLDTTTGVVSVPNPPTVGTITISTLGGAPTTIALSDLDSVLSGLLASLGAVLPSSASPVLQITPPATSVSGDGHSGSAESADLKLELLGGLVILDVGDAKVTATDTPGTGSKVITSPAPPPLTAIPAPPESTVANPVTPPAASVVPGVTTVHTGEFWAGTLPIVLLSGMGLTGLLLIARRRIASATRSFIPLSRLMAHGPLAGPPPGPASGTSSVPPPVSGAGPVAASAVSRMS